MDRDFYSFVRLSDLDLNLTFRISSLQGTLDRISRTQLLEKPEARHWGAQHSKFPDLIVECRLFSDNKPLSVPVKTAYKPFRNKHQWNEWITLPYKLCDLPLGAQLTFTIYDVASSNTTRVIGGTTLPLFSKKGTLKSAQHRLFVWKGVKGDGSVETATPSKVGEMKDEMGRLEKLIKRHERGDLPRVDWLDKLAYRQVEKVHKLESQSSDRLFLYLDFPRFELPIVFCEAESILPSADASNGLASLSNAMIGPSSGASIGGERAAGHELGGPGSVVSTASNNPSSAAAAAAAAAAALSTADPNRITSSLFTIFDPEIMRSNPVEAKHRRLVRSHRSGPLDRELKPSAEVRDELNEILSYPPTRVLTPAEMDRVWSFRFYLTRDPKGLTKFLKSVVWTDQGEAKQATEVLLPMWTEPGLDDALELLGPTFKDPRVRSYAVRQLERAEDEELILYLLQLVQALKFEKPVTHSSGGQAGSASGDRESESRRLPATRPPAKSPSNSLTVDGAEEDSSGLADFLIRRGVASPLLGNNLYWYLEVECEDPKTGTLFKAVKRRFLDRLGSLPTGAERRETITRQATLLAVLSRRAKELRSNRDARPKKIEKLRALIADPKNGLNRFDPPLMLPLDASISVTGIVADKSSIFKSNLFPLRLEFTTVVNTAVKLSDGEDVEASGHLPHSITASLIEDDEEGSLLNDESRPGGSSKDKDDKKAGEVGNYTLIFKNGDDLRQDQLVIQLFSLMDRLLRNENLDLKMTPYRVLATGSIDGMVQFVDSLSIAAILSAHQNSLLNFLRAHHPQPTSLSTYGVDPGVFETFIRSCAGYCVVTYLLGVGDRHLDNLLLSSDGHFFHVDFGYILGRDPKPFPPPVKVCKEMVDAMGGTQSPHYARFKAFCYTAFTNLRKNANLILNLVALMVDANIPDIRLEPDKAVLKVQDKFLLHLSEDEAIKEFEGLLNETSYLSTMFDRLHDMAQYFRQ
ncbi:related to phosphatidylinositol 3-kinase [Ustilago bromivora]|uniref:Phosphatidylinositol 3-kinase VPS34 n=1 Tax=Ustilago bromivora TaxID=307758 RepID=A0A1K0H698_9BASI|nr:related to phosphatidylinositol 3-kinase [Ustilago bromivora]SYW77077.1 related to phosphatidylinositol 3-kinase [Ustilago bromivora]